MLPSGFAVCGAAVVIHRQDEVLLSEVKSGVVDQAESDIELRLVR
jgi:hypothetical protein